MKDSQLDSILNGIMKNGNYTNRDYILLFTSIKNDKIIERLKEARKILEFNKKMGNNLISQKLLNSLSNMIKKLTPYWENGNLSPASSYHPMSPTSSYRSPSYHPLSRSPSPVPRPRSWSLPRPRPPLPRPRR